MMNDSAPHAFTGATGVTINDNAIINNAKNITNIHQNVAAFEPKVSLAEKLNPVFGAAYDSGEREDFNGCAPGTRVDLLAEIDNWIARNDDASIFWLSGVAGTGKSTIAHTVADRYRTRGASFFFSRDHINRTDFKNVIKMLAYQLGNQIPLMKKEILDEIENNQSTLHSTLSIQLQKLILQPLVNIEKHLKGIKIVIVLDALDECHQHGQENLLNILVKHLKPVKFPIKFFITSRPEANLEYLFQATAMVPLTNPFILHNIKKENVNKDIRLYMEQEFCEIPVKKPWPKPEEIDKLIEICSQLFIAASTATKFIRNGRGLFQNRLNSILQNKYVKSHRSSYSHRSLDDMYQKILETVAESDYWNDQIFRAIISVIILGFSTMNIQTILNITGFEDPEGGIYEMLLDLKAVLLVPLADSNAPIHAFHSSFHDFLTNPDRCKDEQFFINPKMHHAEITKYCLNTLTAGLKVNICDIDDMAAKTEDIPKDNITDAIQYAATYWILHIAEVDLEQEVEVLQLFTKFIFQYLLPWIEVVSLCGELSRVIESIKLCKHILVDKLSVNSTELFKDAERFILQNFDIIKTHVLQTYSTALLFTPQETLLYKTYKHVLKKTELLQGYSKQWDPSLHVLEGHSDVVRSIAISQDGMTIASGSDDGIVRVWKLHTGEHVYELQGHSEGVRSVAISYDGSIIVSGACDKSVRVWNSQTGKLLWKFDDHSDWVTSVAVSQDGVIVVSGSHDHTIRIWNSLTGKFVKKILGHSGWVNAVAISQDGSILASGSSDTSIGVWSLIKGELIHELQGHLDWVNSVVISQDMSTIISGSYDKTIHVWNLQTGNLVNVFQGYLGSDNSISISHDMSMIVSGSGNETFSVWDLQTGEYIKELQGHLNIVNAVAISPDGANFASGSFDMTVRVWSLQDDKPASKIKAESYSVNTISSSTVITRTLVSHIKNHINTVNSINISQDQSTVFSVSSDMTLQVWSLQTGKLLTTLQGHSDAVNSIAISQDGSTIVSGSGDTVRAWRSQTGELISELKGHSDLVWSVSISQDGSTIISGSQDDSVRVWNSHTGECVNVLREHMSRVNSVTMSLDGSIIVSGSNDWTVRLWSPMTGECIKYLVHSHAVHCVAISQDGSTIVSGSRDNTICLWNLHTGECIKTWTADVSIYALRLNEDGLCVILKDRQLLTLSTSSETNSFSKSLYDENSKDDILMVDDWIVKSRRKLLWLSNDFRPSSADATAATPNRMVIGTSLGRVVIISLDSGGDK